MITGFSGRNDSVKGLLCLGLALLIAGCAAQPTQRFVLGDTIKRVDFSQPYQWEQYVHPEQKVDFEIKAGFYEARAWDGGFMWVDSPPMTHDLVVEAEATQLSDYRNNAYGIMCRVQPTDNGDGYYFLISGDGQYTIRRGAVDNIGALIPWTYSSAIRQDKGINRIRAVCIGDYLALYVNDSFVAETRDDYFSSGYGGLTVAVVKGGNVDITFDDLTLTEASLAK
jgi:hypothetical protein